MEFMAVKIRALIRSGVTTQEEDDLKLGGSLISPRDLPPIYFPNSTLRNLTLIEIM